MTASRDGDAALGSSEFCRPVGTDQCRRRLIRIGLASVEVIRSIKNGRTAVTPESAKRAPHGAVKESTSRSRPAAQSRALVLVADDDEDVLALTCICLERAGYRTARALDGEEALRLAREQLPNLCVLDLVMPKLSGLDVATELRKSQSLATVPVIILTAAAHAIDQDRCLKAGADEYLTKPFSGAELERRVRALIGEGA
jgi:CheY-like chemotaxis protein